MFYMADFKPVYREASKEAAEDVLDLLEEGGQYHIRCQSQVD